MEKSALLHCCCYHCIGGRTDQQNRSSSSTVNIEVLTAMQGPGELLGGRRKASKNRRNKKSHRSRPTSGGGMGVTPE